MVHYHPSYDPLAGFDSLNRSIAWAFDAEFQKMANATFETIISNDNDDPLLMVAYDALPPAKTRKRLEVAQWLESKLPDYWTTHHVEDKEIKLLEQELHSLYHYLHTVEDCISADETIQSIIRENPNTPSQRIEAIVYYLLIKHPNHKDEFLWFSQAHYYYAHIVKDSTMDYINLPLHAFLFKDKYLAYPAIVFCQSLLEAMHFVRRVFDGNECLSVTVKDFPIELRNYCFDQYVEYRAKEQLKILFEDNDRQETPDEREAKSVLLRNEMKVFDEFAEDNDMNPEAVRMARYLIERLKDELGVSDRSQPYCTYSIPDAAKSRDEIEADILRMSKEEAPRFARFLISYERQQLFDFRGDTPRDIFNYMAERYDLPYSAGQFIRNFKR